MSQLIIAVDGTIGAGKTTVLRRIMQRSPMQGAPPLRLFEEDVDSWEPLLERFYAEPDRYSFLLQARILSSMREQHDQMQARAGVHIVERSPDSARVFVELARQDGLMCAEEHETYHLLHAQLGWSPDAVVWIDTPVDVARARIRQRDRPSERNMSEAYLRRLHEVYSRTMRETAAYRVDGSLPEERVEEEVSRILHNIVQQQNDREGKGLDQYYRDI